MFAPEQEAEMYFIVVLATLSGLWMTYLAIRMMRSEEFTVRLANARWNPRGRMFTKIWGLERNVRFHRKVLSPILVVVSAGLFVVAVYAAIGGGK